MAGALIPSDIQGAPGQGVRPGPGQLDFGGRGQMVSSSRASGGVQIHGQVVQGILAGCGQADLVGRGEAVGVPRIGQVVQGQCVSCDRLLGGGGQADLVGGNQTLWRGRVYGCGVQVDPGPVHSVLPGSGQPGLVSGHDEVVGPPVLQAPDLVAAQAAVDHGIAGGISVPASQVHGVEAGIHAVPGIEGTAVHHHVVDAAVHEGSDAVAAVDDGVPQGVPVIHAEPNLVGGIQHVLDRAERLQVGGSGDHVVGVPVRETTDLPASVAVIRHCVPGGVAMIGIQADALHPRCVVHMDVRIDLVAHRNHMVDPAAGEPGDASGGGLVDHGVPGPEGVPGTEIDEVAGRIYTAPGREIQAHGVRARGHPFREDIRSLDIGSGPIGDDVVGGGCTYGGDHGPHGPPSSGRDHGSRHRLDPGVIHGRQEDLRPVQGRHHALAPVLVVGDEGLDGALDPVVGTGTRPRPHHCPDSAASASTGAGGRDGHDVGGALRGQLDGAPGGDGGSGHEGLNGAQDVIHRNRGTRGHHNPAHAAAGTGRTQRSRHGGDSGVVRRRQPHRSRIQAHDGAAVDKGLNGGFDAVDRYGARAGEDHAPGASPRPAAGPCHGHRPHEGLGRGLQNHAVPGGHGGAGDGGTHGSKHEVHRSRRPHGEAAAARPADGEPEAQRPAHGHDQRPIRRLEMDGTRAGDHLGVVGRKGRHRVVNHMNGDRPRTGSEHASASGDYPARPGQGDGDHEGGGLGLEPDLPLGDDLGLSNIRTGGLADHTHGQGRPHREPGRAARTQAPAQPDGHGADHGGILRREEEVFPRPNDGSGGIAARDERLRGVDNGVRGGRPAEGQIGTCRPADHQVPDHGGVSGGQQDIPPCAQVAFLGAGACLVEDRVDRECGADHTASPGKRDRADHAPRHGGVHRGEREIPANRRHRRPLDNRLGASEHRVDRDRGGGGEVLGQLTASRKGGEDRGLEGTERDRSSRLHLAVPFHTRGHGARRGVHHKGPAQGQTVGSLNIARRSHDHRCVRRRQPEIVPCGGTRSADHGLGAVHHRGDGQGAPCREVLCIGPAGRQVGRNQDGPGFQPKIPARLHRGPCDAGRDGVHHRVEGERGTRREGLGAPNRPCQAAHHGQVPGLHGQVLGCKGVGGGHGALHPARQAVHGQGASRGQGFCDLTAHGQVLHHAQVARLQADVSGGRLQHHPRAGGRPLPVEVHGFGRIHVQLGGGVEQLDARVVEDPHVVCAALGQTLHSPGAVALVDDRIAAFQAVRYAEADGARVLVQGGGRVEGQGADPLEALLSGLGRCRDVHGDPGLGGLSGLRQPDRDLIQSDDEVGAHGPQTLDGSIRAVGVQHLVARPETMGGIEGDGVTRIVNLGVVKDQGVRLDQRRRAALGQGDVHRRSSLGRG